MATNSMEANIREIRAVAEVEGEANWLQEHCASQEADFGRPKRVVVKKDDVSRKVRRFYLVKLWPYKDPDEQSKIEQAEKFIKKMDQKSIPLTESYRIKWSLLDRAYSQLDRLRRRQRILDYAVSWKQEKLVHLQSALDDKLNLVKNLHSKSNQPARALLHGTMNLAAEKKLLQEIPTSPNLRPLDSNFDRDLIYYFMERLKEFIQWFYGQIRQGNNGRTGYKKLLKQMKHLEENLDKTSASQQKGRIWDLCISRKIIQDQINLLKNWKLSEEIKGQEAELIAEIERVERDKRLAEKEAACLANQLYDIKQEKEEAEKCIHNLRKRHEEANVSYCEYLSAVSRARELAKKKDVAALEELSRVQVEKFMSRWNNSKVFRSSYVKRIQPSLNNRQLSQDGRMRNHDEEPTRAVMQHTTQSS